MNICEVHSHSNGLDYLQNQRSDIWIEVCDVIRNVDAEACKTKISKEKRKVGKELYSPTEMNKSFARLFHSHNWKEYRVPFFATGDYELNEKLVDKDVNEQKRIIDESGVKEVFSSYNQIDFLKDKVAVEVQFGKYSFVAHDIYVKHMSFYKAGLIDVGVEILPMKVLEKEMSSGVPYYERDLMNLARQGRGLPLVPIVLVGVAP